MDFQKMLADAQAKADTNGDGKLTMDDVDALAKRHGIDPKMVDDLKTKGDVNGDGKVDLEDLKAGFGNAGTMFEDAKSKLFGNK